MAFKGRGAGLNPARDKFMLISRARREYKRKFGQANHLLITSLIGLDAIQSGAITQKPLTLRAAWNPKDPKRSASRAREMVLSSFLVLAVDSLDAYFILANRKPTLWQDSTLQSGFDACGQSVHKKAMFMSEFLEVDKVLTALMDIMIIARNNLTHFGASNELRPETISVAKSSKEIIKEQFRNLSIDTLIGNATGGKPLTLKEVASLISAAHLFVESVDQKLITRLNIVKYVLDYLAPHLKKGSPYRQSQAGRKYEEKLSHLDKLLRSEGGLALSEADLIEVLEATT